MYKSETPVSNPLLDKPGWAVTDTQTPTPNTHPFLLIEVGCRREVESHISASITLRKLINKSIMWQEEKNGKGLGMQPSGWCFPSPPTSSYATCLPGSLELLKYSFYTQGRYDGLAARGLHRTCEKGACNEKQDILIQIHHSTIYHLVPDTSVFSEVQAFQMVWFVTSARTASPYPMQTKL